MQCPNCGEYKVGKIGKGLVIFGLVFAVLALPWTLILIGIPFLLGGLLIAAIGYGRMKSGDPYFCGACHWRGALPDTTATES